MGKRLDEIERRIGDIEKNVAVLRAKVFGIREVAETGYKSGCEAGYGAAPEAGGSVDEVGSVAARGASRSVRSGYGVGGSRPYPVDAELEDYGTTYHQDRAPISVKQESLGVVHNRLGEPYSIKLVYPGFYQALDIAIPYCTIGFPNSKERLAKKVEKGTVFFIYITSPVRRVIGLTQALGVAEYRGDVDALRPWVVTLEWVIGPKADGVSFADVGLEVRARTGDSVYAIPQDIAEELIEKLQGLRDLEQGEVASLRERFRA